MSTSLRDTIRTIRKEQQDKYYTHRNMHVTQRDQHRNMHTMSMEKENMFLRKENKYLLSRLDLLRSRLAHMQDMLRLFAHRAQHPEDAQHAQHAHRDLLGSKRTRHSAYYDHLHEPLHF